MAQLKARDIRIASPCHKNWNQMVGSEQVRYCPECQRSVYNFSAMTTSEVEAIAAAREGRLCVRFYQAADGSMQIQNSPRGLHESIRRASLVAASAMSALLTFGPAMAVTPQQNQEPQLVQIKPAAAPPILQVVDPEGAVISGAKVSLTNESSGAVILGETDERGEYRRVDLSGTYTVAVSALGFRQLKMQGILLPTKDKLPIKLEVALVVMGEMVEVPAMTTEPATAANKLTEPAAIQPNKAVVGEIVMADHRNPVRKFFSRLRHLF
jgi:hypothetical protein